MFKQNTVGLFPPASSGSLGDEAMLRGIVTELNASSSTPLQYTLFRHAIRELPYYFGKDNLSIRSLPAPRFEARSFPRNIVDTVVNFQANKALAKQHSFYVFGADALDGAYSVSHSLRLIKLAEAAADAGSNSTLVGFSWNQAPAQQCIDAIKNLAGKVRICVRDPVSFERLQAITTDRVELVADAAYLLRPDFSEPEVVTATNWITAEREKGHHVIGLNSSPTLYKMASVSREQFVAGLVDAIKEFSNHIQGKLSFVGISHDRRGAIADEPLIQEVFNALESIPSFMVPSSVTSAGAKAICSRLDLLITSRMHLAIGSMGSGTPAIPFDYQGKVAGMLKHWNMEQLMVRPDDLSSRGQFAKQLIQTFEQRESLRVEIKNRYPAVLELARRNIADTNQ